MAWPRRRYWRWGGWGGWGWGYPPAYSYPPQYPPAQAPQQPYYGYPPMAPPWAAPPMTPEQELQQLEEYKKELEAEKKDIEEEIKEVEARIEELKKMLQERQQPPGPPGLHKIIRQPINSNPPFFVNDKLFGVEIVE